MLYSVTLNFPRSLSCRLSEPHHLTLPALCLRLYIQGIQVNLNISLSTVVTEVKSMKIKCKAKLIENNWSLITVFHYLAACPSMPRMEYPWASYFCHVADGFLLIVEDAAIQAPPGNTSITMRLRVPVVSLGLLIQAPLRSTARYEGRGKATGGPGAQRLSKPGLLEQVITSKCWTGPQFASQLLC